MKDISWLSLWDCHGFRQSLNYRGSASGYILKEKFPGKISFGRNPHHGQYKVFIAYTTFEYFSCNFFRSIFVSLCSFVK